MRSLDFGILPDDSRLGILRDMPRKQKGQLIRTTNSFLIRYYITDETGNRKQKCEKLADRDEQYRTAKDVRDLYDRGMARVNGDGLQAQVGLSSYVEPEWRETPRPTRRNDLTVVPV